MLMLRARDVQAVLRKGSSARMPDQITARFKPGQRVLARNINPLGHTRIPRYVRGRLGVVDRDHGVFYLPDAHAAGLGKVPQHLYNVCFSARALWGETASATDCVLVDLWDDYLAPA